MRPPHCGRPVRVLDVDVIVQFLRGWHALWIADEGLRLVDEAAKMATRTAATNYLAEVGLRRGSAAEHFGTRTV